MNDNHKINRPGELSAFERIRAIGERSAIMKADGFDEGHDALIRFLDDLREHMGWPTPDVGTAALTVAQLWRLKTINDHSRGGARTRYDLNFAYMKRGPGFEHACTLDVTHPGAPVRASFDFNAKPQGTKGDPAKWTILMGGTELVRLDLSDYNSPREALEEATKRIGSALYYATWNG